MTIKVAHRRRFVSMLPARILSVIVILTLFCGCVSSMPTTELGAHCFHSYSKRSCLQVWGLSRRRSTDTQHKHTAASSLSVRGGSFALPHTEVTEFGTQTSVDYSAGGYVVSMNTVEPLTDTTGSHQRPYTLFSSLKVTSLVPSKPSANDDVDLPPFFRRIFGEKSAFLLMIPLTVLKLIVLL
jgi:hypothetical protein